MFYVGQKVVCVDDTTAPGTVWGCAEKPQAGEIYTIRYAGIRAGRDTVWLEEIERDTGSRIEHGDDVGYGAYRFRPIVERKTDISIFKAMLGPKTAEIDA